MYLIASLGNPSPEYDGTRHNLGRAAVERWLTQYETQPLNVPGFSGKSFRLNSKKLQAMVVASDLGTYMNESGPAIVAVMAFFKIPVENLILVHDDVDLPLGTLRISHDAAGAGHRGVESVITALGTKNFTRLRLGIETRADKSIPPTEDFVLQKFSDSETPLVEEMIRRGAMALNSIITNGLEKTMTEFNKP